MCSVAFSDNLKLSEHTSVLSDLLDIHLKGWVIEEVPKKAFQGLNAGAVPSVLDVLQGFAEVIDADANIERLAVDNLAVLIWGSHFGIDRQEALEGNIGKREYWLVNSGPWSKVWLRARVIQERIFGVILG